MKLLFDSCISSLVANELKKEGHDVVSAAEWTEDPGDEAILAVALQQKRILVTLDKDFGELVFKEKLAHAGVILLRLKDESVGNKKKVLEKALRAKKNFYRKFTVIRG